MEISPCFAYGGKINYKKITKSLKQQGSGNIIRLQIERYGNIVGVLSNYTIPSYNYYAKNIIGRQNGKTFIPTDRDKFFGPVNGRLP